MRWADIIAFFTSTFWLGCSVTFGIVPMVLMPAAKHRYVDATTAQVGELFGQIALFWIPLSLSLLGVLALARIVGWVIRLRRRQFKRVSLIGVLVFAGVAVFAVLAAQSYETVEAQRVAKDDLDEDSPELIKAEAEFAPVHERSKRLSQILTALLLVQSAVLAVSLARRTPTPAPASATPTAA